MVTVTKRRTFAQMMSPTLGSPNRSHHWPRYLVSAPHAIVPPGSPDQVRSPMTPGMLVKPVARSLPVALLPMGGSSSGPSSSRMPAPRACPECAEVTRRRP